MIIKGKSRGAPSGLAAYLLQIRENESVELKETFGTASKDIDGAFAEMAAIAAASDCKNFLYHASINPKEGEHLTPEQWGAAVDLLAKNLGLEDHQRAVVEHVKGGRAHYHIVFNRVNGETLKAVRMSHSYRKHEKTSRELEKEFGLDVVRGAFDHEGGSGGPLPEKPYGQKDFDQARRTKVDPRKVAVELSEAWTASNNGADFIKEAAARGYVIAQGDRRDFVAIDEGGGVHSVARRTKTKVKNVREKMEDISAASLPDVERAREMQKERRAIRKGATLYDSGGMESQQRDALRHAKDKNKARKAAVDDFASEIDAHVSTGPQAPHKEQPKPEQQQIKPQTATPEPAPQQGQAHNGNSGAIGKEKGQAEQRDNQKKNRTEQTAEQIEQQRKNAMREMFEKRFGHGHSTATKENWEQSRGGRTRER